MRYVIIVSGNPKEANHFVRTYKEKEDIRNWVYLEDVKELARVDNADVVYTGSYMSRPDIQGIVEGVKHMVAGKKADVYLLPLKVEHAGFSISSFE